MGTSQQESEKKNPSSQKVIANERKTSKIRFSKYIKKAIKKFKRWMNHTRNHHKKLFDALITIFAVTIGSTSIFSAFYYSVPFAATILIIASLLSLLSQWALLTGRFERKYSRITTFIRKLSEKALLYSCNCESKDRSFLNIHMHVYLEETVTELEKILESYYGQTICATIKLLFRNEKDEQFLQTYGRGVKSYENRGGMANAKLHDSYPCDITRNYAYSKVITDKYTYFMAGDLENLKSGDTFKCEYDNWKSFFLSTIVFPIRVPINKISNEYPIVGVICIDSRSVVDEWKAEVGDIDDFFALSLLSATANCLYPLCKKYRDIEMPSFKSVSDTI